MTFLHEAAESQFELQTVIDAFRAGIRRLSQTADG